MITLDLFDPEGSSIDLMNPPLAAGRIPQFPQADFAILVWGMILDPPFTPLLRDVIEARLGASSQPVYMAGWSRLVFQGIAKGCASFVPAMPILCPLEPGNPKNTKFLLDSSGSPLTLTQHWPDQATIESRELEFDSYLEQPYGYLSLQFALRSAWLEVDPSDAVLLPNVVCAPLQYSPDFYRERQLMRFGSSGSEIRLARDEEIESR